MKKLFAIISALAVSLSAVSVKPSIAAEQTKTVSISDADDFLKFAEECRINSNSEGLVAELKA